MSPEMKRRKEKGYCLRRGKIQAKSPGNVYRYYWYEWGLGGNLTMVPDGLILILPGVQNMDGKGDTEEPVPAGTEIIRECDWYGQSIIAGGNDTHA